MYVGSSTAVTYPYQGQLMGKRHSRKLALLGRVVIAVRGRWVLGEH